MSVMALNVAYSTKMNLTGVTWSDKSETNIPSGESFFYRGDEGDRAKFDREEGGVYFLIPKNLVSSIFDTTVRRPYST